MSLRPKPVWSKTKSSGLPQYYKDKLPSNRYSSNPSSWINSPKKVRLLKRLSIGSVALLFVYYLFFSGSSSSNNKNSSSSNSIWTERRDVVKDVFKASWNDYTKNGWGADIYAPVSGKGKNMKKEGPLGWIIVDSLDTLVLMNLKDELEDAKSWVSYELSYEIDASVHTFETTIRMLGGLLSTYYLTEDEVYAEKAVNLGNKLLAAFDGPNNLPASEVNLKTGATFYDHSGISTSEITTLQLEFKYLANITGEAMYWDAVDKVMGLINDANNTPYENARDGLVPIFINPKTGLYNSELIRLGSRADSYYEYLLKQYLQTGEEAYLNMYKQSFNGIKKHLTGRSKPNNYLFFGELERGLDGPLSTKMDHLVCFFGGLFALGATNGLTLTEAQKQSWWNNDHKEQLVYAEELTKTCYHMYHDTTGTGLAPEIVFFNQQNENDRKGPGDAYWSKDGDFYVKRTDTHNLQRPETVESLYYLYKITGDVKYREWGWELFESFLKFTGIGGPEKLGGFKGPLRFTCLKNVFKTTNLGRYNDNMESFWLAETLKYFYLLFSDEDMEGGKKWKKWNLQNIIFNTEAHPLPRLSHVSFSSNWNTENLASNPDRESGMLESNNIIADKEPVVEKSSKDNLLDSEKLIKAQTEDLSDFIFDDDDENDIATDNNIKKAVPNDGTGKLGEGLDASALKKSENIANGMKDKGKIPISKGKISKPLNDQVMAAKEDVDDDDDKIDSIDELDPALEAELF